MTPPGPNSVETAAVLADDIEAIKRVFAGRLRVMDTKQWDLYASFHTDDIVSETWGGLPTAKQPAADGESNRVVGGVALTRAISRLLDGPVRVTTVHHGHCPEITVTSPTTATGIWSMEDKLWWSEGDVEHHLHGYGHYHENYRKVDGRWFISYRKLTRQRVDATPGFWSFIEEL
ncbi:nuclear transport factor 2 family protein [Rhodococcus sp. NPDC059234]|uniref:nuclear transport factor 2 family protein n=1 Tax=Rhodococcus sp. NPDC059234 TaxID=3346781 RepID=UPI00366F7F09